MKSLFKYKSLYQQTRQRDCIRDGKEKLSFHNRPQNKHSSYTIIFYIYTYEMQRDICIWKYKQQETPLK